MYELNLHNKQVSWIVVGPIAGLAMMKYERQLELNCLSKPFPSYPSLFTGVPVFTCLSVRAYWETLWHLIRKSRQRGFTDRILSVYDGEGKDYARAYHWIQRWALKQMGAGQYESV